MKFCNSFISLSMSTSVWWHVSYATWHLYDSCMATPLVHIYRGKFPSSSIEPCKIFPYSHSSLHKDLFFFNHGEIGNTLGLPGLGPGSNPSTATINPKVYPTVHKPNIPITCDSTRAETSRGDAYPLSLITMSLSLDGIWSLVG